MKFVTLGLAILLWISAVGLEIKVQNLQRELEKQNERGNKLEQQNRELEDKLEMEMEVSKLRSYFRSQKAPIADYSSGFFRVRDLYGVDPYLLAAVAMAESGGCKRYIKTTNNCFGWGGGRIRFDSIDDGILQVGRYIGTSRTYGEYQRQGSIRAFARAYNFPYWQDYERKISGFIAEIKANE